MTSAATSGFSFSGGSIRFRSFFGASGFDGGSFVEVSTVDKLLFSVFSTLTVTAEEGVGLRGATLASGFLLADARYTESLFFRSVLPDPPPTAARTGTLMVFRCSTTIGSSIPRSCLIRKCDNRENY